MTTLLQPATLERLQLPWVTLAVGTLLGGAFFHMIPGGMAALSPLTAAVWLVIDLVPEIKSHRSLGAAAVHLGFYVGGLAMTLALAYILRESRLT